MKTLANRKRERQAAAAAAEQAQSVSPSVPANQMRKPICRKGLFYAEIYVVMCFTDQPYKPSALDLEQMYGATRVFTICNEKDMNVPPPSYEDALQARTKAVLITSRS